MNSAAIGGERLGVLISAGGRSAMNIHDACMSGELGDARIAIVIAHREEIEGVARCRAAGLRVAVLAQGDAQADAQADALDDRIDAALAVRRSISSASPAISATFAWVNAGAVGRSTSTPGCCRTSADPACSGCMFTAPCSPPEAHRVVALCTRSTSNTTTEL